MGFLSCCQDLEGLSQVNSVSETGSARGGGGHRHDRCTLEDQTVYHWSPVGPGDRQGTVK